MPRPKAPFPKAKMAVYLPQELAAFLRVKFASEDHVYGTTKGALSEYVSQAIVEKMEREREKGSNGNDLPSLALHE